jgi:hypothetical protein
MHWWDDIVTAVLAGIAAFLAAMAASAVGWTNKPKPETKIDTQTPKEVKR